MKFISCFFGLLILAIFSPPCFAQDSLENFDLFIKKFGSDSAFQSSRLLDSVEVNQSTEIIFDENGNGHTETITKMIARQNWRYDDMSFKESMDYKVSCKGFECEYTVFGLDNGISISYGFVAINGSWFLTYFSDMSM